ncbi:MAG: recombinase family protein [Erysipelotrichaceae bacterium]|nr:recombinase family protein [Oscillospiraceae bacterium]MBR0420798.1 recombinase family protein [Erysipelotrichaceae bacterium]
MAIWGYARVSTMQQNEDRQVVELRPLVTTESHLLVEKQSGKDFDRPIYQSLKNIMREGDTLVIKSLDRLGRNYEQMKEEWKDLSDRGIKIRVLDTPMLDTSKYDDELMGKFVSDIVLNVLSFVAENERKNIKQRQKEGIAIAKAKGVKFGRPAKPYPDNYEYVINEWKEGRIKAVEATKLMNVSKTTFYKMAKTTKSVR